MVNSLPMINPLTFVGIGEVLFDVFEDGNETLGGAPLNFAIHVHHSFCPNVLHDEFIYEVVEL